MRNYLPLTCTNFRISSSQPYVMFASLWMFSTSSFTDWTNATGLLQYPITVRIKFGKGSARWQAYGDCVLFASTAYHKKQYSSGRDTTVWETIEDTYLVWAWRRAPTSDVSWKLLCVLQRGEVAVPALDWRNVWLLCRTLRTKGVEERRLREYWAGYNVVSQDVPHKSSLSYVLALIF